MSLQILGVEVDVHAAVAVKVGDESIPLEVDFKVLQEYPDPNPVHALVPRWGPALSRIQELREAGEV